MNQSMISIRKGEHGPISQIHYQGRMEDETNPFMVNYWVENILAQSLLENNLDIESPAEDEIGELPNSLVTLIMSTKNIRIKINEEEISLTNYDHGEIALLMQLAMQVLKKKETITLNELRSKLKARQTLENASYYKLPI